MLGNLSSTSSYFLAFRCTISSVSVAIITGTIAVKILLLLPLSSFVLYLGHQRWRQYRFLKPASHSDFFTFHLAAMELLWVFGCFFFLSGLYTNQTLMTVVATYICYITFYGEMFFHLLTCVERYLAVVHPITYCGLKNTRGVRIRNISIGGSWLLSISLSSTNMPMTQKYEMIPVFCFFILSVLVISFCSISVLCVLIRARPKEGAREREGLDQSKQRAFCHISVISVVVWVWFVGLFCCKTLSQLGTVSQNVQCLVKASVGWFNLPSSLVLPVLYLHKNRKLLCCRAPR